MLKGIPNIISPDLLKILMEMGHGDEIVLADGNFPAASCAQKLVRCDGHGVPTLLEAILKLFPIDTHVKNPVALMGTGQEDQMHPSIWEEYKNIVNKYHMDKLCFEYMDRYEFYSRAKKAYAIIATGEKAIYANIIIKKGVIADQE